MAVILASHAHIDAGRDRWFAASMAAWLVAALVGTAIGVAMRWPAQFGGAGDPSHVGGELVGKGTVLSPPLWMIALVLAAGLLATLASRPWRLVGVVVAALVGAIGAVGAGGEVVAAATPDVPHAAQLCGLVGVVLSVALVASSVLVIGRRR